MWRIPCTLWEWAVRSESCTHTDTLSQRIDLKFRLRHSASCAGQLLHCSFTLLRRWSARRPTSYTVSVASQICAEKRTGCRILFFLCSSSSLLLLFMVPPARFMPEMACTDTQGGKHRKAEDEWETQRAVLCSLAALCVKVEAKCLHLCRSL